VIRSLSWKGLFQFLPERNNFLILHPRWIRCSQYLFGQEISPQKYSRLSAGNSILLSDQSNFNLDALNLLPILVSENSL